MQLFSVPNAYFPFACAARVMLPLKQVSSPALSFWMKSKRSSAGNIWHMVARSVRAMTQSKETTPRA